jgi:solute carrier family 35, member F5
MQKCVFDDPYYIFQKERWNVRQRRYALGIFFIFLVSAAWVTSSVVSQFLYNERSFESPFLVTYIGICLFTFLLPFKRCTDTIGLTQDTTCTTSSCSGEATSDTKEIGDDISIEYENLDKLQNDIQKLQTKHTTRKCMLDCIVVDSPNEAYNLRKNASDAHVSATNDNCMVQQISDSTGNNRTNGVPDVEDEVITVSTQYSSSVTATFALNNPKDNWNHSKHIFVALHIAPAMFLANWLFSASLQETSVVSATVLVSTSGMFAFLLAILTKDETFHWMKLCGGLLGVVGTVLTARHDMYVQNNESNDIVEGTENDLWGDVLALLAAVAFATYAVQVRLLCPSDENKYSMSLLLGYIGLFITIPLLPIAIYLLSKTNITIEIIILITLRGLFDYVICEYLHFRAFVLTNATIATVGLGLTIPMAFIADFAMGKSNIISPSSLMGAISVTIGFILVNIADNEENIQCPRVGTNTNTIIVESDGILRDNPSTEDCCSNGYSLHATHDHLENSYKSKIIV